MRRQDRQRLRFEVHRLTGDVAHLDASEKPHLVPLLRNPAGPGDDVPAVSACVEQLDHRFVHDRRAVIRAVLESRRFDHEPRLTDGIHDREFELLEYVLGGGLRHVRSQLALFTDEQPARAGRDGKQEDQRCPSRPTHGLR